MDLRLFAKITILLLPPLTTAHTTATPLPPPPMPPTPKVKAKHWGKANKKHLSDLIREGDINISNASYASIKDV
jgi:hypothetical protein